MHRTQTIGSNASRAVGVLVGPNDVATWVETAVARSADDRLMLHKHYIRRLFGLKVKHTLRFWIGIDRNQCNT